MDKGKEEKLFQIKDLSEKQIRVMKDALEMYTRLGILQFDHLVDHMFNWGKSETFSDAFLENRDEIQRHCFAIRNLLASKDDEMRTYDKHGHWSLGIGGPKTPVVSQIAYELEKDIDLVINNSSKSRLALTDETPSTVKEQNLREEKLKQVIKNLKDK